MAFFRRTPVVPVRVRQSLDSPRAARVREEARSAARRARREVLILGPMFAGVLLVYAHRRDLFGTGTEQAVQAATVLALVILGWALARDVGRALGPTLLGRLDPATAGTVGFLIRLIAIGLAILVALRIAGLPPRTLAVGGAFTAVVVGLAAQQTLGNLFAGMVLLSARPFRVGERIRLQGGGLAGTTDGTVQSLGLLYVTLGQGSDQMMVPNSVVLAVAVTPLREPDAVDFQARLRAGVKVSDVQRLLTETVTVPTRGVPHIDLEGMDDDEVVVRISAVPVDAEDGWRLADEVLQAVDRITRDEITVEHIVGRADAPRTGAGGEAPRGRERAVAAEGDGPPRPAREPGGEPDGHRRERRRARAGDGGP
jgi:small conductance mechanosensitive channel